MISLTIPLFFFRLEYEGTLAVVIFRADLLPDGALVFEKQIYEEPEDLLEDLTTVLGLRTSGDAYEEFLYKGEKLSIVRRRLEELREAGLSNDQALLLRLRDTGAGAFNFGRSKYW